MVEQQFVFNQIHIEAARNASDDFNLFHDIYRHSSDFINFFQIME